MALETGLISYYSLEHNAKDSVGSNDGTITGATSIGGKIASGYDFNGSSDYITLPTMNDGSFSISMWINADSITANRRVFDMKEASQNRGIRAYFNGTSLVTNVYDDTTSSSVTTTGITTSAGWQHLVITSNSTGDLIVYIDNTNKGTDSTGGAMVAPTDGKLLYIGQSGSSGDYFDGVIDEVGIWNRALSPTEVSTLYNSGDGMQLVDGTFTAPDSKTQGMVSYYTLNGHIKDLIAANDGTVTGASLTDGKVGQGYDCTGSGNYITINQNANIPNETSYSVNFWVKGAASGDNAVLGFSQNNADAQSWWYTRESTDKLRIFIRNDSNTIRLNVTSTATVFDSSWHMISFTDNNGTYDFLVDNVSQSSGSYTKDTLTLDRFGIGFIDRTSDIQGNCEIDEVGIWNRALSSTEVTELWNSGDGQTFYEDFIDEPDMKEELISYYKLDENAANTTVVDSHGSNTGTASGNTSTLYYASGEINSAFDFNGSSDYVQIQDSIDLRLTTLMSAFVWIKTTSLNANTYLLGKYDHDTGDRDWAIAGGDDGSSGMSIRVVLGDGTTVKKLYDGDTKLDDGNWHHIGFTWDSGILKLFVDGTEETVNKKTDSSLTSIHAGTSAMNIGRRIGNGVGENYSTAVIDEVGIWDRVLSSTEITALSNVFAYPFSSGWSNKMFSIVPGKILAIDVANVANVIGVA